MRSASRSNLVDQDVVTDFARQIGYDGALDRSTQLTNERISGVAILLLDALNELDSRLVTSSLTMQDIWIIPGEDFKLTLPLAKEVMSHFQPHLDYLQDR